MTIHTQAEKIGVVAETVQIQHAYFGNHEKQFLPPPAQAQKRREFYPLTFSPPTHYIPRHELLDTLRQTLLTPSDQPMALTSALHGMGGIGKSVMARALCDDPAVKAHFSAGTLVAVLGEQPSEESLKAKMRDWIQTVGGTITENAPSLDYLSNLLRESLQAQAYLLVLDDVWQTAHARPFLQGGSQCRVLLTTRDREVARQLAATVQTTPTMQPQEAVALLASHADPPLTFSVEDKLRVVKRLGYLPLAIRLAGAQLGFYDNVTTWLAEFKAVDLEAMSVSEGHDDSLRQTFELSLRHLDKPIRQRYQTLAIFKEDEAIPLTALRQVWPDLKLPQLKQTLHLFTQRALVQSQGEGAAQTMSLHDLLRDFMADELGEVGKIQAHQTLLTSYRATRRAEGWHTAPDDGYLHSHLTYHLNAIADQELHGLFVNDAWLHARLQQREGYDGYIDDLMTAWKRVQIPEPDLLVLNVRYALIRTSINSLAQGYVPELVARAVETGLWSPQRALSLAEKIFDDEAKAKMLTLLLATGKLSTLERVHTQALALKSTLAVNYDSPFYDRTTTLKSLIPYLEGELLTQAVLIIKDILIMEDEKRSTEAWAILASQLDESLTQALKITLTMQEEKERAKALVVLISKLKGKQLTQILQYRGVLKVLASQLEGELLTPIFNIVQSVEDERTRVSLLKALAPQLTSELLTEAFHMAQMITEEWHRADVLVVLVPKLAGDLLGQTLQAIIEMKQEHCRVKVFMTLAPRLTSGLLTQALQIAQNIKSERDRAKLLMILALKLDGEEKRVTFIKALQVALMEKWIEWDSEGYYSSPNEWNNSIKLLKSLTSPLTNQPELLALTLQIVQTLKEDDDRAKLLIALAPRLTIELLEHALESVLMIEKEDNRTRALVALIPRLTGELLNKALEATLVIKEGYKRTEVLIVLAPQLTGKDKQIALTQALQGIQPNSNKLSYNIHGWSDTPKTENLIALAPYLTDDLLINALQIALTIETKVNRAKVLMVLAPLLAKGEKEIALTKALETALPIDYEQYSSSVHILTALAPQLTNELLAKVLQEVLIVKDASKRAYALMALASNLVGEVKQITLTQALESAVWAIKSEGSIDALIALAPQLPHELLIKACVITTNEIKNEEFRANVLVALAKQLTGKNKQIALSHALQAVRNINDPWRCADTLRPLIPQLIELDEQTTLAQTLQGILHTMDEWPYTDTLAELMTQTTQTTLSLTLQMVLIFFHEQEHADTLIALAPVLADKLLTHALNMARAIENKESRAKVLIALAMQLPEKEKQATLSEVLNDALAIYDKKSRDEVFTNLSLQLTGNDKDIALTHVLQANLAIETKKDNLAPHLSGTELTQLQTALHATLIEGLVNRQHQPRHEVLEFLSIEGLFSPTALGVPTADMVAEIVGLIHEICTQWRWG